MPEDLFSPGQLILISPPKKSHVYLVKSFDDKKSKSKKLKKGSIAMVIKDKGECIATGYGTDSQKMHRVEVLSPEGRGIIFLDPVRDWSNLDHSDL